MAYLLIVDDDEDFAGAAARVLRGDGHEVEIALDTKTAVTNMRQRRPDIAVLDVMFPEDAAAGFVLARTMKHDTGQLDQIPILMLTAVNAKYPLGFSGDDIDGEWMPVAGFLEKPVDFDALREKVAELLAEAAAGARECAP